MIKLLNISNVGPAKVVSMEFGKRLNLLTGDNGLGKSFLLDIVWWALTRKWPAEINSKLTVGRKAVPSSDKLASINFSFSGKSKETSYESSFLRTTQSWTGKQGRPSNPGLVLYAMADGSFAVWDPHRNYWLTKDGLDTQERIPAYIFSPTEVWDGLQDHNSVWLCNGLIRDWAGWQKERGAPFTHLKNVLKTLSPDSTEVIKPGKLTRISIDDVRDIPTIRMAYHQDVPVVNASAGMRRIIALAYFLVWAWEEHKKAAKQLAEPTTKQITFLIDEVESHLHPSWQRNIIPVLLSVMDNLTKDTQVQLIAATHSPMIMTSVEPIFDAEKDAWFDLDLVDNEVSFKRRVFEKHGDAGGWLISEAFDLESGRSVEYERLIKEASALLELPKPDEHEVLSMYKRLTEALGPKDEYLFRWRAICDRKGFLK